MVGAVCTGCGGDEDGSLGGRGDGRNGDGDGLSWWEDNISHIILGEEPNALLAYAPGLEHHHPIMSTIGVHRGRLERERDRCSFNCPIFLFHMLGEATILCMFGLEPMEG